LMRLGLVMNGLRWILDQIGVRHMIDGKPVTKISIVGGNVYLTV